MIQFRVSVLPVAQPRSRAVSIDGHAAVYAAPKSHPIHAFKATVRLAAHESLIKLGAAAPLEGPLQLTTEFILPRPAAKCWKTKPTPSYWHTGKPDVDNLWKAVADSLTGLIWRDDSQIAVASIYKRVAAGGEQPGMIVQVEPAGDVIRF